MTRRIAAAIGAALLCLWLLAPLAHGAQDAGDEDASDDAPNELTVPKAVVLGVVEGLTEYLPISSTGHLTVTNRVLDIGQTDETEDAADSYIVAIQAGAIVAVLVLYRRRIGRVLNGFAGRDVEGRNLGLALIVSFVPAVVLALALEDVIKGQLFGPWPVVAAWIAGGVGILGWVRYRATKSDAGIELDAITMRMAVLIGLAQCVALWPGVSRSLLVIIGSLAVGMSLAAAVEYAFLLGLITLGAATAYEALTNGSEIIDTFGWTSVLVGVLAAFVSALIAVRWMVGYLQRRDLSIFGWYRIGAGVLTAILLATGAI
jgi:undecaprenyl-diphosphatase